MSSDAKRAGKRRLAAYNSKWHVFFDSVEAPNGSIVPDYLVVEPRRRSANGIAGVTVLPVGGDHVLPIDVHRQATQVRGLEAVRGFIDDGEAPEAAALRELAEEAGVTTTLDKLLPLGMIAPEASTIAGRSALFAALDVKQTNDRRDHGEFGLGDCCPYTLDEVREMLRRYAVEDAVTVIALHCYLDWLEDQVT